MSIVYDVVSLTFTVVPTIVDQYNVTLNVTYATNLPKPALQVSPYALEFSFFPEDVPNGKYACSLSVTNTHPTASVRNLSLSASQLDIAQPIGQQLHVTFANGTSMYQVGDLGGQASVSVPCSATVDNGTVPSHSAGNIIVQANYDYSMNGQVLQGTTTTNVPVSYIQPAELAYAPIQFTYDERDPLNPTLQYTAGSFVNSVKSNRGVTLDMLQPPPAPFNGHNLVAFTQTQAGADDLGTININQANSFWHTDFDNAKQSLLVEGSSTTYDISKPDGGLNLQQAIAAQINANPNQILNQPTYLGFEGQWADGTAPNGFLIPVRITTITNQSITTPQPPQQGGSGPTTGCLNSSDPICSDPKPGYQPPVPSAEGHVQFIIPQTIKLEREAFNAMLGIGALVPLTNVVSTIHVTDLKGNDASANFFVLITSDPLGATHGGTVTGPGSVSWQLIPNASAGGISAQGQQYHVQAVVSYVVKNTCRRAHIRRWSPLPSCLARN